MVRNTLAADIICMGLLFFSFKYLLDLFRCRRAIKRCEVLEMGIVNMCHQVRQCGATHMESQQICRENSKRATTKTCQYPPKSQHFKWNPITIKRRELKNHLKSTSTRHVKFFFKKKGDKEKGLLGWKEINVRQSANMDVYLHQHCLHASIKLMKLSNKKLMVVSEGKWNIYKFKISFCRCILQFTFLLQTNGSYFLSRLITNALSHGVDFLQSIFFFMLVIFKTFVLHSFYPYSFNKISHLTWHKFFIQHGQKNGYFSSFIQHTCWKKNAQT